MRFCSVVVVVLSFLQAVFASTLPDTVFTPHKTLPQASTIHNASSYAHSIGLSWRDVPSRKDARQPNDVMKARRSLHNRTNAVQPRNALFTATSVSAPASASSSPSPQEKLERLMPIYREKFGEDMQIGSKYAFELTFPRRLSDRFHPKRIQALQRQLGYSHKGLLVGSVSAQMGFAGVVYDQVLYCSW